MSKGTDGVVKFRVTCKWRPTGGTTTNAAPLIVLGDAVGYAVNAGTIDLPEVQPFVAIERLPDDDLR